MSLACKYKFAENSNLRRLDRRNFCIARLRVIFLPQKIKMIKKMTAPNGHWPCNTKNFAGNLE
jgi:hypothetical protein